MKIDSDKIAQRYVSVIIIVVLIAVLVIIKAAVLMTFGRKDWAVVAQQFKADSVYVQQQRGSILSDERQVMVCSTPEYDFVFKYTEGSQDKRRLHKRDSTLKADMKGICDTLAMILPERTSEEFRRLLNSALDNKAKYTKLYPKRLPYDKYKKTRDFVGVGSGFVFDEVMIRKNTYDRLAARTLGRWDVEAKAPRDGIELAYDSLLRGKPGLAHRRKVERGYNEFIDVAPRNGYDIVTTINVSIQDIAQRALMKQMAEQDADYGTAIVMETKTGDIKAIVNLTQQEGSFVIGNNIAINQGIETGSIFKTASILAALDDKKVSLSDSVSTAPFSRTFYGKTIADDSGKDKDWKTIPEILQYSSNVGTMTVIDEHYVKQGKADAFLKKLQSMGIANDHQVLPGARRSKLKTHEQLKNWKGEALWMAVGYGISVTPMNMVAFYNAIANGGKMMSPRLIQQIESDGHVVEAYKPEVVVDAIASSEAINDITQCLVTVVNMPRGTGFRAQSEKFLVAGKTGTAKITEHGEYAGRWLNFCGFFPADAPEYTCGVFVYRKSGHSGTANGGGTMSAPVFKEIAEQVMAYRMATQVAADSLALCKPVTEMVKKGNSKETEVVLDGLKIKDVSLYSSDAQAEHGFVPDVIGMGAKDAVYAMEQAGAHVRLYGKGRVYHQSVQAGATIRKGMMIDLRLN